MKIDPRITRGLDEDDKKLVLSEYRASKNLREMLVRVLTESVDSAIIGDESVDLYKNPNALAEIANSRGYRRGLRQAIKLLEEGL